MIDVRDKIENNAYANKMPWDLPKPVISEDITVRQSKEILEQYERDKRNYRNDYRAETSRLERLFKEDLEKEFGLENHPKKDRLYDIAYDHGHSSGYFEIYYEYSKLSDLLK